ncbi:sugar transporter family protein [Stylonychia lemnae]|uniref:Hexose transporter 1 n=1 Tax=Stylonychia lemnae TaxID=5949 RepID=A0A078AMJ0_STYLE|nr:sugar transporter family protein [Stylonychia lemnae]|eukprot:CDW82078.1 sugar transporter family protein [Stylonychia lemnae]
MKQYSLIKDDDANLNNNDINVTTSNNMGVSFTESGIGTNVFGSMKLILGASIPNRMNNTTFVKQKVKFFKVNWGFLCFYIFIASLGVFQLGIVLAANNQVSTVFDIQFGLKDQSQKNFYHTMIGSSCVFGAVLGSLIGGKVITVLGRRRSTIFFNLFAAVSIGITMIENFYTLCLGRLLFGICGGIFQVVLPKQIEETVPNHLYGSFGVVSALTINGGEMLGIVMGLGLPDSQDEEAMSKTTFWRYIFGSPWVFQVITLVSYFFILKHDTIKYLIDNNKDAEALQMVKKVYHKSEDHQYILDYIKMTSSLGKGNRISLKDALTNKLYWRATWFCFTFALISQFSGVNGIIWYSGTILQRLQNQGGSGTISPKLGSVLIGVVNFIGTVVAVIPLRYFGRKTLVLVGHLLMGTFMVLVGVFAYLEYSNLMLTMILLFLIVFQSTDGPILQLYGSEVTVDQGLGFCVFGIKSSGLIVSLTTEYLMDSPLHPYGAFWLYGGIIWISFIFFWIFMKETKGLTDRQKKSIFRKDYDPLDYNNQTP